MGVENLLSLHETYIFAAGAKNVTNTIAWNLFVWCVPHEEQTALLLQYSKASLRALAAKTLKEAIKPHKLRV